MDEIKTLIDDILTNSSDLPEEKVKKFRNLSNPYGIVCPATDSWANISVTNLRDQYLRRLHMTSLVGYLMRNLEEYEYEPTDEQLRDLGQHSNVDYHDKMKAVWGAKHEENKVHIRKFLYNLFEYNPDKHVRTSYTENKDDPERPKRFDAFQKNMEISRDYAKVKNGLSADRLEAQTLALASAGERLAHAVKEIQSVVSGVDELSALLTIPAEQLNSALADVRALAKPLSATGVTETLTMNIPAEAFYHWNRYLTNHYEDLREVVNVLYTDKPDLEYAIQYMDHFETEEEAKAHQQKYENVFITTVTTVKNGGWTLLGAFKKNRDREDFYNKNTEALKQMFKQVEADQRMGSDMLKQKVSSQKKKSIAEMGPDDPDLAKYTSAMATIDNLGAKQLLTAEERKKLNEAVRAKEDLEVPDEAVQVDIFHTDPKKGFSRSTMYTQADDPKTQHELMGKTVVDRHGRSTDIANLKLKNDK